MFDVSDIKIVQPPPIPFVARHAAGNDPVNLLAPELFLILAHAVYKM